MDSNDFLSMVYDMYEDAIRNDKNSYEVNEEQMRKLSDAYSFFVRIAASCNGRVEQEDIIPSQKSVGITATFDLVSLFGDDVKKLSEIVSTMSSLSIDSLIDGKVVISFNIPDVFKKTEVDPEVVKRNSELKRGKLHVVE